MLAHATVHRDRLKIIIDKINGKIKQISLLFKLVEYEENEFNYDINSTFTVNLTENTINEHVSAMNDILADFQKYGDIVQLVLATQEASEPDLYLADLISE